MKRYKSIKRNKTKQRRKTRNRRNKKRKKTHGRHNNKRRKTNIKGGSDTKPTPIPNPTPIPPPPPLPPLPPPQPSPIHGLNLITEYENFKTDNLYILSAEADLLYMYIHKDKLPGLTHRSEIEFEIELLTKTDPENECMLEILESILGRHDDPYYSLFECSSYFQPPLVYRIAQDDNPNYLCCREKMKWGLLGFHLYEISFSYIKSIYNVYQIDEWPPFLPTPPEGRGIDNIAPYKFSKLQECPEDYIKQNINKVECNRKCCGWPRSGYVCGMVDDPAGPKGTCIKKEKTGIKQNPTY